MLKFSLTSTFPPVRTIFMQRRGKRKKLEYWKRGEKNYDDLCCPFLPSLPTKHISMWKKRRWQSHNHQQQHYGSFSYMQIVV